MTVMAYKMISGEEIVGEIGEQTAEYIQLINPAAIVFQDDGHGKIGMGLAPFIPYAKRSAKGSEVGMMVSAIAFMMEVDVKLENEYNRIFGSGIQIASANDLRR